jgi:hypothetical protein
LTERVSGRTPAQALGRTLIARLPPSSSEGQLMNLYTIGAICGIIALVLVVIFVL